MSDIPEATPQSDSGSQPPQPEASEPSSATPSVWRERLPVLSFPLSRVQMLVGLTAGVLSISGFLYPALRATRTPLPLGEVVTVVHEASSRRPVTDATVEILTPVHVLVTTLTPRDEGRARHTIKEGTYRVRVTHPRFAPEMRSIEVLAGTIAEVRFKLSPRPVRPRPVPAPAASPTSRPAAAAVLAAPRVPASEPAPVEKAGLTGLRRTLLRDQQSP